MPALVVHGEADPRPREHAEELVGLLRGSRLLLVPDAGHLSFLDRPEVVRPTRPASGGPRRRGRAPHLVVSPNT